MVLFRWSVVCYFTIGSNCGFLMRGLITEGSWDVIYIEMRLSCYREQLIQ